MKRLAAFVLLLAGIGSAYASDGDAERLRAWRAGEKVTEEAVAEYGIDRLCTWGEMSRFTAQGAINAGMKDVTHFETKEAMQRSLMNELDAPCMILVKGSRGMHMDSVVDCLTEKDKGSVEHE